MFAPSTLLGLASGHFTTVDWTNGVLVFIDYQDEYVDGVMLLGELGA